MSRLEIDLEKEIRNYLTSKRHIVFPKPLASLAINRADIEAGINGIYVAMEVKRPEQPAKITKGQLKFLEIVNESGGIGRRITSIAEVDEIIKETERLRSLINATETIPEGIIRKD